jgi:hypothetical protein
MCVAGARGPLSRGRPTPQCRCSAQSLLLRLHQEAFQAQARSIPDDVEFPGLDWEGWQAIAETLGISGTVDAPIFRHESRRPRCAPQRCSAADAILTK